MWIHNVIAKDDFIKGNRVCMVHVALVGAVMACHGSLRTDWRFWQISQLFGILRSL